MTNLPDQHLDLGCGAHPRNPYARSMLHAVDIRAKEELEFDGTLKFEYRQANLIVDPIPYEDNRFGSVSAFDFIEHVPRLLLAPGGRDTTLPFVRLMSEVWRVLAPGGRFYALTPAYPGAPAFQDPTHVNFITEGTYSYFCGEKPFGGIYGFAGRFEPRRVEWVLPDDALTPQTPLTLQQRWRRARRKFRGKLTHLVWELEAVKQPPAQG